jgi:predicted nucleic acid-binding Zn ribbon protein
MPKEELNIGQVLDKMFDRYKLNSKLTEAKLIQNWPRIVGPIIDKHTRKLEVKGKTLYVYVNNPVLKNELFFQRDQILGNCNEFLEEVLLEKIFIGD